MFKKVYKIYIIYQFCSISKIGGGVAFSVDSPKTLYFPCNSFSLHRTENLIKDSSIP